jgi:hypothetical protein
VIALLRILGDVTVGDQSLQHARHGRFRQFASRADLAHLRMAVIDRAQDTQAAMQGIHRGHGARTIM